jgi:hypothetical protein
MVLLSNDNPINIKKNHMLKCLEKKKQNFDIMIIPMKEKIIIEESNKNINLDFSNLTDKDIKDIKSIFDMNDKKN